MEGSFSAILSNDQLLKIMVRENLTLLQHSSSSASPASASSAAIWSRLLTFMAHLLMARRQCSKGEAHSDVASV
jgi:hypothetical protein